MFVYVEGWLKCNSTAYRTLPLHAQSLAPYIEPCQKSYLFVEPAVSTDHSNTGYIEFILQSQYTHIPYPYICPHLNLGFIDTYLSHHWTRHQKMPYFSISTPNNSILIYYSSPPVIFFLQAYRTFLKTWMDTRAGFLFFA